MAYPKKRSLVPATLREGYEHGTWQAYRRGVNRAKGCGCPDCTEAFQRYCERNEVKRDWERLRQAQAGPGGRNPYPPRWPELTEADVDNFIAARQAVWAAERARRAAKRAEPGGLPRPVRPRPTMQDPDPQPAPVYRLLDL